MPEPADGLELAEVVDRCSLVGSCRVGSRIMNLDGDGPFGRFLPHASIHDRLAAVFNRRQQGTPSDPGTDVGGTTYNLAYAVNPPLTTVPNESVGLSFKVSTE